MCRARTRYSHTPVCFTIAETVDMLPALRVLLVEDSKVLTERLTEAIRQIPDVELIGTADTEAAALAEILVADLDGDPDKPLHARLSTREFQIFCKLAAGRGVSDIANELSLSVKTVSTYRSRILEKMSFHANADITSYALRNGLIQ